nr:MYXO-CTERM sorting domain-containing protein [Myxococcus sp. RHSTA-1-4]
MGVATAASAEWDVFSVDGVPRWVNTWRPGVVSVATTEAARLWENGTVTGDILEFFAPGTFLSPSGCFAVVRRDGALLSPPLHCLSGGIADNPNTTFHDVQRVRITPSSTGYSMGLTEPDELELLFSGEGQAASPPWDRLLVNPTYRPTYVLGVTDTNGGAPHAIFQVTDNSSMRHLLWFRGHDLVSEVVVAGIPATVEHSTVDLFATEGPDPVALIGNASGLFRGQLTPPSSPGPVSPFSPVTVQGSPSVSIASVDVNTGKGSRLGEGYGLAVGTDGSGNNVVLGAVPADSAADAGTLWRVHPAFAGLPGAPMEVSCVDSTFCAIALNRATAFNVVVYSNAAKPEFTAGTGALNVDESSGPTVHQVVATDGDGDAVRVSMDATAAAGLLDVSAVAQPDQLELRLSAREVCKDETRVLQLFASDGLKDHDVDGGVSVRVVNRNGPAAPGVSPSRASTVAGGSARVFTASPGAGPCPPRDYVWSGTPALVTDGSGTATFNPPAVVCQSEGATYTYTVQARDEGGVWSAATLFTVDVAPWGRPSVPFGPGARLALASGPDAGVDVVPEALHECTGTAGLPPVETVWRLGMAVPVGLSVKDANGGTVSPESPVVGERLRVEAAACTRASLELIARNRMETGAGGVQEGAESTVRVDVAPPVEDVTAAGLNLTEVRGGDGQVDIQLGSTLLCPAEYTLKARMFLRDTAGGTLADAVVDVPGSWRPPLPAACTVQEYVVRGELFEESGGAQRNGGTAELRVSTEALQPALGALEGEALEARCGEGATATLTQTIPSNACREVAITWTQVSGPALEEGTLSGEQVSVATSGTELEALVGESVVLRVTADAGDGRSATTEHVVPITVAPFVDVVHETESPLGSETGLVGVVARLRNTSECRVGGLVHLERVEGVEWVPGSVKVDGRPVVERAVDGGFEVDGITLEAGATGTLTYVVRPALLGSARHGGEVFLNRVLVSGSIPDAPSSGCGCSGGGSGAAVFGLVALARLLRRRRAGAEG